MSEHKISHTDVAARHQNVAATFTARVDGVHDWDAPTPVGEWLARDIVRHLVDWSRGMFGAVEGVIFGDIPSVDEDPAAAWHRHTEQMQMLLDNPAVEKLVLDNPHFGTQPLLQAVSTFYVPDVFMHTWALAKASGQESGLDQATCHAMLEGMEKQEASLRASGQFGVRQPVADDAPSDDQLAAFIGRDPHCTAPTR